MKRSLIALAVGTFALGIAEFGMMGILDNVARGINVDIVKAGHLIAAYSLGVAIGSTMLVALRRTPLRRLMLALAAVIFGGNLLAALASGYEMLLAARFVSGLPHGAFFGAGAIVCSRLADKGRGAEAVAVMVGGMTVANVVGTPLATMLCNLLSWRATFGAIALTGFAALVLIRMWVPYLPALPDSGGIKGQFRFLRKAEPWLIYAGVFFGQASVYCWLSYINPFMTRVTGIPGADMTWVMMLAGLGMVAGNALAGRMSTRHPASAVAACIAASLLIVMPAIYLCATHAAATLGLMFLATAGLFGIGGPLQYLIVRYAKGGEMLGGAGIQIAFNVSNAMSAALGGAAIDAGLGLASPALVGLPFAAIGAAALAVLYRRYERRN